MENTTFTRQWKSFSDQSYFYSIEKLYLERNIYQFMIKSIYLYVKKKVVKPTY